MKTPQEIAEEYIMKVALHDDKCLDDIIPLAQLIEVARAANGLSLGTDWNNGTHAKDHGYRERLLNGIIALKQTGKADWL